jgi:hypothetical protein
MTRNPNRLVLFLSAASLVGSAGVASAQGVGNDPERRERKEAQKAERRAEQERAQADRAQARAARERQEAQRAERNTETQRAQAAAARRAEVQRAEAERAAARAARERQEARRAERNAEAQRADVYAARQAEVARVSQARISAAEQDRRIQLQKKRMEAYNMALAQKAAVAKQREAELRRANRQAQYRYQQDYLRRLEQQRYAASRYNTYNYSNDPYFYTAPSHRYYRNGQYYSVNQYAANQLRESVDAGYAEGYRAGQADRADGYRFNYRDSFAYQDANFGFNGMYVDQSEYNHYFREGFERGYQDGYYSRNQFGTVSGGRMNILSTVLNAILALQSLR